MTFHNGYIMCPGGFFQLLSQLESDFTPAVNHDITGRQSRIAENIQYRRYMGAVGQKVNLISGFNGHIGQRDQMISPFQGYNTDVKRADHVFDTRPCFADQGRRFPTF